MTSLVLNLSSPFKASVTVSGGAWNGPSVADNVAAATSLTLFGAGAPNYGERLNANFLHLLENFSNVYPPEYPIEGQMWYAVEKYVHNTTTNKWLGWDYRTSSWMDIQVVVSAEEPPAGVGTIWYRSSDATLWMYSSFLNQSGAKWHPCVYGKLNANPLGAPRAQMYVYSSDGWSSMGSAMVQDTVPTRNFQGQLWYDSGNDTIHVWDDVSQMYIGLCSSAGRVIMTRTVSDAALNLGLHTIRDLADPILDTDAASVHYLNLAVNMASGDTAALLHEHVNDLDVHLTQDQRAMISAIAVSADELNALEGMRLPLLAQLQSISDVQNANYADCVKVVGDSMTGPLMSQIQPVADTHVVNKLYVDTALALGSLADVVIPSGGLQDGAVLSYSQAHQKWVAVSAASGLTVTVSSARVKAEQVATVVATIVREDGTVADVSLDPHTSWTVTNLTTGRADPNFLTRSSSNVVLTAPILDAEANYEIKASYTVSSLLQSKCLVTVEEKLTVVDVAIIGSDTIAPTSQESYRALASFNDGTVRDVTAVVKWGATDVTVPVNGGVVSAVNMASVRPGAYTITAEFAGPYNVVVGTKIVRILDGVASLSIVGGMSSITVYDGTQPYVFTGSAVMYSGAQTTITTDGSWSALKGRITGGIYFPAPLNVDSTDEVITLYYGGKTATANLMLVQGIVDEYELTIQGPSTTPDNVSARYRAYFKNITKNTSYEVTASCMWSVTPANGTVSLGVFSPSAVLNSTQCVVHASYVDPVTTGTFHADYNVTLTQSTTYSIRPHPTQGSAVIGSEKRSKFIIVKTVNGVDATWDGPTYWSIGPSYIGATIDQYGVVTAPIVATSFYGTISAGCTIDGKVTTLTLDVSFVPVAQSAVQLIITNSGPAVPTGNMVQALMLQCNVRYSNGTQAAADANSVTWSFSPADAVIRAGVYDAGKTLCLNTTDIVVDTDVVVNVQYSGLSGSATYRVAKSATYTPPAVITPQSVVDPAGTLTVVSNQTITVGTDTPAIRRLYIGALGGGGRGGRGGAAMYAMRSQLPYVGACLSPGYNYSWTNSYGGAVTGGGGGQAGYLQIVTIDVALGDKIGVVIGPGGNANSPSGGTTIVTINGNPVVQAQGGLPGADGQFKIFGDYTVPTTVKVRSIALGGGAVDTGSEVSTFDGGGAPGGDTVFGVGGVGGPFSGDGPGGFAGQPASKFGAGGGGGGADEGRDTASGGDGAAGVVVLAWGSSIDELITAVPAGTYPGAVGKTAISCQTMTLNPPLANQDEAPYIDVSGGL